MAVKRARPKREIDPKRLRPRKKARIKGLGPYRSLKWTRLISTYDQFKIVMMSATCMTHRIADVASSNCS
jgi:hypothetical protein